MISRRKFILRSSQAALVLGATNLDVLASPSTGNFRYQSPFIALELSGEEPQLIAFSTDGLGKHHFLPSPVLKKDRPGESAYTGRPGKNRIRYYRKGSGGKTPVWEISCKQKEIRLRSRLDGNVSGEPFEMAFSQRANHCTVLGKMTASGAMQFPCVLHFPGMGTFRVTCSDPRVTFPYQADRKVQEPFVKFQLPAAGERYPDITYRFESVLIYPASDKIPDDPVFDGFKRDFINMYQMNPNIRALANNSASDACAFTLFLYAEMARHTPPLAEGLTAMQLVGDSLDRYLNGMKGYGQVGYAGWNGEYDSCDSGPSLIIAACYYIAGAHDKVWAEKHYPALLGWARKMMDTDKNHDGIIEYGYSGNSGSWNGKIRPANWWDTIGFGHDDAYSNALAYRAATLLADVAASLGRQKDQATLGGFADTLKKNYYTHFYHEETGVLAGWKSADGQLHDYCFTFVNSIAVCYGLVNASEGKAIMTKMLEKMKEVGYTRFDLGLPGNLIPVAPEDYTDKTRRWGYENFQVYENGGATGCYAYYTLHALYQLGMRAEAEAIFMPMMKSYSEGSFQGNCVDSTMTRDWKTWDGACWGYEGFLVDNYLTLLTVADHLELPGNQLV